MQQYHFIAIGGAVMHQMAIMLKKHGNAVSGSDDNIFEPALTNLANEGILPGEFGWFPERIHKELDAVILGMHARADNPELIRAKELNIPIYSFPEFLYERSKNKTRVVIAGSHGKTTTTSMIMHILRYNNIDFDYMVGARIAGFDQMVSISDAPLVVLEGDEYLTSPLDARSKFLHYHPHIAVLTGIAWDHINVFPTYEGYLDTFREFIKSIEPGGTLIYNAEDDEINRVLDSKPANVDQIAYLPFDYKIDDTGTTVNVDGRTFRLEIFGKHNISNITAAVEVCKLLGISAVDAIKAAATFVGAAKRLEKIFDDPDRKLTVYRDFAHAPSKVSATVAAVRDRYKDRQVVAVLELHTFSSIQQDFLPQYAHSLDLVDKAVVFLDAEIFKLKGYEMLSWLEIVQGFQRNDILILNTGKQLEEFLREEPAHNTVFLFMSSGAFGGFDPNKHWS